MYGPASGSAGSAQLQLFKVCLCVHVGCLQPEARRAPSGSTGSAVVSGSLWAPAEKGVGTVGGTGRDERGLGRGKPQ